MQINDLIKEYKIPKPGNPKVKFEFQEIGLELEPFYGKGIWPLFYKPFVTEFKIRKAHEIAKKRGIFQLRYLIGIIKKL